jgi:DMSO/TMAO reductase YedYZ molybdopterin-dependent catalytic subunit
MGRAAFLSVVGLGGVGILAGGRLTRLVSGPLDAAGSVLPASIQSFVPGGWRIYSINPPWPSFDPASYRLSVGGHVRRPLELSWSRVQALPQAEQVRDFHCVTGWSVGGVHWAGVRMTTLLDMVQPLSSARYVNFVSLEQPYVDTLSLEQASLHDVMLAHSMNGAPLSRAHGAPLRLVIPEMYGYKNVKWLARIELVPRLEPGFWEQNGYDVDAWVGRSNGY